MKPHRSLFAKILLWFFLTLLALAAVLFGFFNLQFHLGPKLPFGDHGEDRLFSIVRLLSRDLAESGPDRWSETLERYSSAYEVEFSLFEAGGRFLAGKTRQPPPEVMVRLAEPGPDFRSMPGPRPPGPHRFSVRTDHPRRYWVGLRIPFIVDRARPPIPATLLIASESMTGRGLFFDPVPILIISAVIFFVSVLFWLPLARSITRPIAQMTRATERISRGQFDIRLTETRGDEIGSLSRSINTMAARLSGYVQGQKRFLGDVAHELASPIARIQLGLGILEQRVDEANRERVREVTEEVEQLSGLVGELLSFTRAEVNPGRVEIKPVLLAPIVRRVLQRERFEGVDIRISVEEDLQALGDPELLARALANLVRNAAAYAGNAGPIEIAARHEGTEAIIEVKDCGKGVPEESLTQLFEPFYRPAASRGRETGGVGLGLAIVKTCVQACRGSVSAKNTPPAGFVVSIRLQAAAK